MEGWFVTVLRTDQILVLDTRAEVVGLSAGAVWQQQRQVAEQRSTLRGLPGTDKSTSAVDSTAK